MQQSVHRANIDKRAVIRQAAHHATDSCSLGYFSIPVLPGGAILFFGDHAAIHHYVFIGHVQLDNAAADVLPYQLLHLSRLTNAAARGRHERTNAYIDAQAAFDSAV